MSKDRILIQESVPTDSPPTGHSFIYKDPADGLIKEMDDAGTVSNYGPESGSNSNGKWVKFPDGTMIVTGTLASGLTSISNSGGVYRYDFTYSQTFTETHHGNIIEDQKASWSRNFDISMSISLSDGRFYTTEGPDLLHNYKYIIHGKWK